MFRDFQTKSKKSVDEKKSSAPITTPGKSVANTVDVTKTQLYDIRTNDTFLSILAPKVSTPPPPTQKVQPTKPSPAPALKPIPPPPPPPPKKPAAAVIPSKPNPPPAPLPKLPPLRPTPNPELQNVAKPITPRTVDPPKPENISKSTVSTDSDTPTNSSNVLSSILPSTTPVVKEKVSQVLKEKTTVKDNKITSKDKAGFMLPMPKPSTTKPGIFLSIYHHIQAISISQKYRY